MAADNSKLDTMGLLSALFSESSASQIRSVDMDELFNQHASTQDDFDATCLLHRMGGDGGLINILRHFFELVMDDPVLAPFLSGLDMSETKNQFTQFLTLLLGNKLPDDFDVALYLMELQFQYYQSLGQKREIIDQEHYDLFVGYLPEACEEVEMEQEIIDELMDTFLPYGKIFNEEFRDRKIRHSMLKTAQHSIDERMKECNISEPTRGRIARTNSGDGIIAKSGQRQRPRPKTNTRAERSQSMKGSAKPQRPSLTMPKTRPKARSQSVQYGASGIPSGQMRRQSGERRRSGEHLRGIFKSMTSSRSSQRHLDAADED